MPDRNPTRVIHSDYPDAKKRDGDWSLQENPPIDRANPRRGLNMENSNREDHDFYPVVGNCSSHIATAANTLMATSLPSILVFASFRLAGRCFTCVIIGGGGGGRCEGGGKYNDCKKRCLLYLLMFRD